MVIAFPFWESVMLFPPARVSVPEETWAITPDVFPVRVTVVQVLRLNRLGCTVSSHGDVHCAGPVLESTVTPPPTPVKRDRPGGVGGVRGHDP